jgi:hypothetical protein
MDRWGRLGVLRRDIVTASRLEIDTFSETYVKLRPTLLRTKGTD